MKAILMIDEMPKECSDCPCMNTLGLYCKADKKGRYCFLEDKDEWCPLIEINDNIAKLIEVAR